MITSEWVQTMSRYNAWQNDWLVPAISGLSEAEAEKDRGLFFGSIRRTASHVLWADEIWLSRFVGAAKDGGGLDASVDWCPTIADWIARRPAMDADIQVWAEGLDDCAGDLTWMSPMLGKEVSRPKAVLFMHYFNHQTHHRGQMHATLTALGVTTADTDLFIMPGLQ